MKSSDIPLSLPDAAFEDPFARLGKFFSRHEPGIEPYGTGQDIVTKKNNILFRYKV
jgi:hypothetical protein